jgi:hypothetical protein
VVSIGKVSRDLVGRVLEWQARYVSSMLGAFCWGLVRQARRVKERQGEDSLVTVWQARHGTINCK